MVGFDLVPVAVEISYLILLYHFAEGLKVHGEITKNVNS